MSAFEGGPGGPGGQGVDINDILQQMFGMGMGGGEMPGMGGFPGGPGMGGPRGPRKGRNEEQQYEVTLEELYKGKTTRFASTKNVVCTTCQGSGGKDKAKPQNCTVCEGTGKVTSIRQVGPMLTQEVSPCATCKGSGKVYKEKDRCKKCKGNRVVEQKKVLELYIPPGSREGDKIVLAGEADQQPDQEPGDIIFELVETPHETFNRAGADLSADIHISLAEALTGFSRVVLTHLDGRGISLTVKQPKGRISQPDQVLKVVGEGMPVKRSDSKGDLYLIVKVDFPEDGWIQNDAIIQKLRDALPQPPMAPTAEIVDEVEFDPDANLDEFGGGSDDPRGGAQWEDEDEEADGAQCATQ